MKAILQKILAILARATINRYRPMVVGVTGSVGKTTARMAIFTVLKKKYRARTAEKNYNNEIGLPLAILGIPHYERNIFLWGIAFVKLAIRLVFREHSYPEVLVLEYGVDRPGDMDYLLSIAKPRIAVVTALGKIPVHVEYFADTEALAREKEKVIKSLPADGWAILNHDDPRVYDMKERTSARVQTYGLSENAGLEIINLEIRTRPNIHLSEVPDGISFKIKHGGTIVPIRLAVFGSSSAYAAAASLGVGIAMGMNLVEISQALETFKPLPGRMRLLTGIKGSWILDDTYNASPDSMQSAIKTLKELPARRRIAVLGDMLELGRFTEEAHRAIGARVQESADVLFTVGVRAKFIVEEAAAEGMERVNIKMFDDSQTAGQELDRFIEPGDLILIKGSQGMRMEKAVFEIMAQPERVEELLVRQDKYWKNK